MGVYNGMGFCGEESLVRCSAAMRQYWIIFAKMELMEGVWNWCPHRIGIILGQF
jgi:hypothetical protein